MAKKTETNQSESSQDFDKNYFDLIIKWIENNQRLSILIGVIFLIFSIFIIPYFVTHYQLLFTFDESSAIIGDTIGGIVGPAIALIAAVLTFFAFWVQYKANLQQRMDIAQQRKDFEQQQNDIQFEKKERLKDRFESRFYEMIRLHKENINEISIDKGSEFNHIKVKGRHVISDIVQEIKISFDICEVCLKNEILIKNQGEELNSIERNKYIFRIAYHFVFQGAYSKSFELIKLGEIKNQQKHLKKCKEALIDRKTLNSETVNATIFNAVPKVIFKKFDFPPFQGHAYNLGHYFRHLYQSVKYVVSQKHLITEKEMLEYLSLLRGQLSNQEQALLYLNYLGGYGKKWENNQQKFFTDYLMIHNLPISEVDYAVSPLEEFKEQLKKSKREGRRKIFDQL